MSGLDRAQTPKTRPTPYKRTALVASLDIGTSKIACMIARLKPCRHSDALRGRTHAVELIGQIGMLLFVSLQQRPPLFAQRLAALSDAFLEMLAHAVRDEKLRIFRPPVGTFCALNFIFAQRLAVRFFRVLPLRRTESDVAIYDD